MFQFLPSSLCIFVSSLFLLFSPSAYSQNRLALTHIAIAPTLDGVLDEQVWQQATPFDLAFENNPGEGIPTDIKTSAYLYEDGESLHLAIHAYDSNPENIRAHLSDRDAIWGDDMVGIVLDTFDGERNGYEFYVNPFGVQQDGRVDDTNGWRATTAWNGIWYSAAKITDDGWTAEISIPFRALRFPNSTGELTWGVGIFRAYPRDITRWLTHIQRDPNISCNLCQYHKVSGFTNVKPGNNFQLTPTLTLSKNNTRDDVPGDWDKGDTDSQPGLDLRWGITENAVVNATINPDFSQIEADAAQLNVNNTYSLFLPERRPFFLDGSDYFTTRNFNLVHTRNIAEPDIGVKLTGKSGPHAYGILMADDNATTFLLPGNQSSDVAEYVIEDPIDEDNDTPIGSNIGIARYRMDIGARNQFGALITTRQAEDYRNIVASIDGHIWLGEKDKIRYQTAFSDSANPLSLQHEFNLEEQQQGHAVALDFIRDTRDYRLEANYKNVGSGFRADMGFNSSADYKMISLEGERKYYGDTNSAITRSYLWFDWDYVHDQNDKRLKNQLKLFAAINGTLQSYARLGAIAAEKFYEGDFNSGGDYFDEALLEAYLSFRPLSNLQLQMFALYGDTIDYANSQPGTTTRANITLNFQLSNHLNARLAHNYSTIDTAANPTAIRTDSLQQLDGGKLYSANQTDLRLSYQFDIRNQLKLVMQYTDIQRNAALYQANFDSDDDNNVNAVDKLFSSQIMYSYKLNAQSLFYLGFADRGFQDDTLEGIEKDSRSVFAKVSFAWQS